MSLTYQTYEEYQNNKLAAKQADKMYKTLMDMWEHKSDKFQEYYAELQKSHLYKKHGPLYCQVLSDFTWNRKK